MTRVLFGVALKKIEKKEEPVIPHGMGGGVTVIPREPVVDADPGDETTEEVKD